MSDPHSKPKTEETDSEKEQDQPLTYDEKLADLYRDTSSQNAVTIELSIALAAKGIHFYLETLQAYKFLKNPLDPKKLVTDPDYRRRVERVLERVEGYEKKALKKGTSKIETEINRTKTSLNQVKTTYENLHNNHIELSKQYGEEARRIYNLDEKQIEEVFNRSLTKVKEDPRLSLQQTIRNEARKEAVNAIRNEVKADKNIKQKEFEIQKRIQAAKFDGKNVSFLSATENIKTTETDQRRKILDEGFSSVELTQKGTAGSFDTGAEWKKIYDRENTPGLLERLSSRKKPPTLKPLSGSGVIRRFTNFINLQKKVLEQAREIIRKAVSDFIEKIIKKAIEKIIEWIAKSAIKETAKIALKGLMQAGLQLISNTIAPVVGGIIAYFATDVVMAVGKFLLFLTIGFVFILIVLSDSAPTKKFPVGVGNADIMPVAARFKSNDLAWRSFERRNLILKDENSFSWAQFEKKYLVMTAL